MISGVAKKAHCYSVRVLGCDNSAPWTTIINGLNHAANKITSSKPRRPSIISLSLSGNWAASVNKTLVDILNKGIPIVAAAGNSRYNACYISPAGTPGVITVAASAHLQLLSDDVYYYTNSGPCVDIFAPGYVVQGADCTCKEYCSPSCIQTLTGTSAGAPIVSGVIALHLQKQPNLTPAQIRQKLIQECSKDKLNYRYLEPSLRSSTPNCLVNVNSKLDIQ